MIDPRQQETNNALKGIQPKLPDLDEAPLPSAVYHYTDTAGLLGILDSGVLWATHYRYLNDSSELRYVFDLSAQVASERLRSRSEGSLAQAFLEYASTESPPYGETAYYLCCFSESDNLLSQWRAYSGRQGFSLAFPGDITTNPGLMGVPARQGQTAGITLLRVEYRAERHLEYVTTLIQELVELCDGKHLRSYPDSSLAISHISQFYWGQLERASYRFKHPDFVDEREWRLVSWSRHDEHFRAGAVTLTPYAKFQIFSASHPNPNMGKPPLMAVRHGPTTLPVEAKLALDRLLASQGYPAAYCGRWGSDTPVRL